MFSLSPTALGFELPFSVKYQSFAAKARFLCLAQAAEYIAVEAKSHAADDGLDVDMQEVLLEFSDKDRIGILDWLFKRVGGQGCVQEGWFLFVSFLVYVMRVEGRADSLFLTRFQ